MAYINKYKKCIGYYLFLNKSNLLAWTKTYKNNQGPGH